jgi:hypothetical protein
MAILVAVAEEGTGLGHDSLACVYYMNTLFFSYTGYMY